MVAKQENRKSTFDTFKWGVFFVLLIAGLGANYYFATQVLALRLIAGLMLTCILALIALQTVKGKKALQFARDARIEMRKVIWPTRQETTQTTIIVVVMVIIVALLLWGVDSFLLWAIGLLTGQRG